VIPIRIQKTIKSLKYVHSIFLISSDFNHPPFSKYSIFPYIGKVIKTLFYYMKQNI